VIPLNLFTQEKAGEIIMRGVANSVLMTAVFMMFGAPLQAADWPMLQLSAPFLTAMQEDDGGEEEEEEEDELLDEMDEELNASDAPAKEIEVGGETIGESVGGATGFVFPTGFYVSSDLGGFFRFGGYGDLKDCGNSQICERGEPRLFSDLQPWIGLNVGYDILPWVGIEMALATGFIQDAAPIGYDGRQPDQLATYSSNPAPYRNSPENSAIAMTNVALTGSWYFFDRLGIQGKMFLGGALLTPDPDPTRLNFVRSLTCEAGGWGDPSPDQECGGQFGSDIAGSFGLGMGLRYATLLTNVVIGFDVNMVGVFSPMVQTGHLGYEIDGLSATSFGFGLPIIPAVSFAPVLKYVF
jgi:hypothetical protein